MAGAGGRGTGLGTEQTLGVSSSHLSWQKARLSTTLSLHVARAALHSLAAVMKYLSSIRGGDAACLALNLEGLKELPDDVDVLPVGIPGLVVELVAVLGPPGLGPAGIVGPAVLVEGSKIWTLGTG